MTFYKNFIVSYTKIILIFILTISFSDKILAKTMFQERGWYKIELYGGYESASSFFDMSENRILQLYDSLSPISLSSKDYSMDLSRYYFGAKFNYSFNSEFMTYIDLPLSIYNLKETYLINDSNQRLPKRNYNLTRINYYGIGGKYKLYSEKSFANLNMDIRIPSSFNNQINIDSNKYNLIQLYEVLGGFTTGINFGKSWIETSLSYIYRSKKLKDQLLIHLEGGLETIPNTRLYGVMDFIQSLDSFNNANFIPNQTITQENFLTLGFGFSIYFNKNIFAEFIYNTRIIGKNSWAMSNVYLSTGYAVK